MFIAKNVNAQNTLENNKIISNLISFPHFSQYIASLSSPPVKEFPSDSADASLDIQGRFEKNFFGIPNEPVLINWVKLS